MLEKAAETLQAPNSQGILDGLWTFKNETLGGLSMPLTFVRDQNTPRQICWGTNQTQKGKWVAFNGGTITCL
jgi:branched-chain amino acid transport system substrate-binding protein